jgi:hypothetical protein
VGQPLAASSLAKTSKEGFSSGRGRKTMHFFCARVADTFRRFRL